MASGHTRGPTDSLVRRIMLGYFSILIPVLSATFYDLFVWTLELSWP